MEKLGFRAVTTAAVEAFPSTVTEGIYQRRSNVIRIIEGRVRQHLVHICTMCFAHVVSQPRPRLFVEFRKVRFVFRVDYPNGSPAPQFDTDEERTYFLVRLPLRPAPDESASLMVGTKSALSEHQVTAQMTHEGKPLPDSALVNLARAFPKASAQVTAQVVLNCQPPRSAREIMAHLGLRHWKTFQANYLKPLLEDGVLERTIPDKPKSPLQKYRLTDLIFTSRKKD